MQRLDVLRDEREGERLREQKVLKNREAAAGERARRHARTAAIDVELVQSRPAEIGGAIRQQPAHEPRLVGGRDLAAIRNLKVVVVALNEFDARDRIGRVGERREFERPRAADVHPVHGVPVYGVAGHHGATVSHSTIG